MSYLRVEHTIKLDRKCCVNVYRSVSVLRDVKCGDRRRVLSSYITAPQRDHPNSLKTVTRMPTEGKLNRRREGAALTDKDPLIPTLNKESILSLLINTSV